MFLERFSWGGAVFGSFFSDLSSFFLVYGSSGDCFFVQSFSLFFEGRKNVDRDHRHFMLSHTAK